MGEKPSIFTTPFGPIYRYNVIGAGVDRLDGGGGFDQGDGGPKLDFCLNLETAINCERPTEEEEDVSEEPPPRWRIGRFRRLKSTSSTLNDTYYKTGARNDG